jgi:membrane protease YdiL (CAAX protease family)
MEAPSIPVPLCRVCGSQLEPDNFASVCPTCVQQVIPPQSEQYFALAPTGEKPPTDPDNPPWGLGLGFASWGFSVALSIIIPLIAIAVWLIPQLVGRSTTLSETELRALLEGPTSLLIQVVSIVPAHILTLAFCWAIVTRLGRRPFFEGLGWKWEISPTISRLAPFMSRVLLVLLIIISAIGMIEVLRRRLPQPGDSSASRMLALGVAGVAAASAAALLMLLGRLQRNPESRAAVMIAKGSFVVGVLVAVLAVSVVLERVLPQKEDTVFDLLMKSSREVRIWLALLAVFTAPLVEEVVYRGVLYSALPRRVGTNWSIAIVTLLFAGVHFPQYWGAWAGLAGLTLLSLVLTIVRASTRSIFPCVIIHMLNNIVGAIQILSYTAPPE